MASFTLLKVIKILSTLFTRNFTKELKNDLEDWNAYAIDAKTLSVVFKEPDILFEKGKYKIKPRFKMILNDFFPRYINVLSSKKFRKNVASIRVEGHTSSEWKRILQRENLI